MALPVSRILRICSDCDTAINPGDGFGHDPDGNVVCEDCMPVDLEPELTEDALYGENEYRALGPFEGLNVGFDDEWDDD